MSDRSKTMAPRRRTVTELFFYSLGLFAIQVFWGFNSSTMPLRLLELTGSAGLTGIILSSAGIFGAVAPVLAGSFSDRAVTRWGRRVPFIASGWIVTIAAIFALSFAGSVAVAVPLTVLLYAGFFTAVGPYFALLPDITPEEQRGPASGLMFMVGGPGIICYLLIGAGSGGTWTRTPFLWAIGLTAVPVAAMILSTREDALVQHDPPAMGLIAGALRDRTVMSFFAAQALWWTGIWMVSSFFVHASRDMFGLSTKAAVFNFLLFTICFVVFALPAGMLGRRLGARKVMVGGLVILAASLMAIGFTALRGLVYPLLISAGAGYAAVLAVSFSYFMELLPAGRTAGYMGLYMACQNGALLFGPAAGGAAIEVFGPRGLFAGAGLFIAAGVVLLLVLSGNKTGPRP
jgi:maltose/moltooligosaccharide transporter